MEFKPFEWVVFQIKWGDKGSSPDKKECTTVYAEISHKKSDEGYDLNFISLADAEPDCGYSLEKRKKTSLAEKKPDSRDSLEKKIKKEQPNVVLLKERSLGKEKSEAVRVWIVYNIREQNPILYLRHKLQKAVKTLQDIKKRKKKPDHTTIRFIYKISKMIDNFTPIAEMYITKQNIDRPLYLKFLRGAFQLQEVRDLKGLGKKMKRISKMYQTMDKPKVEAFLKSLKMAPPLPKGKKSDTGPIKKSTAVLFPSADFVQPSDLLPVGTSLQFWYYPTNAAAVELAFRPGTETGVLTKNVLKQQECRGGDFKYNEIEHFSAQINGGKDFQKRRMKRLAERAKNASKEDMNRSKYTRNLQTIPVVVRIKKQGSSEITAVYIIAPPEVKEPSERKLVIGTTSKEVMAVENDYLDGVQKNIEIMSERIAAVQKFVPRDISVKPWWSETMPLPVPESTHTERDQARRRKADTKK